MKKIITFLFAFAILFSCDKSNNEIQKVDCGTITQENGLIGKWKLIETLLDPGDGSGVFQPVVSDKTIEFYNDSNVTSNGSLCDLTTESDSTTYGIYSAADSIISVSSCNSGILNIGYELINSTLVLSYTCYEPCKAKYIKSE
jgi:hypothetical protein